MEEYRFYALLSRMRYITRWGLMRNTFSENIQEHSHMVAVLAHGLAMIRREIFGLTGDLPTPIKYFNPEIKAAYKQVEYVSGTKLLQMLPEELREHYAPLVYENDETVLPIVKAADKLSAHIKCLEELKAGNREFEAAAKQTHDALLAIDLPELHWFLEHCLPPFTYSLDELE